MRLQSDPHRTDTLLSNYGVQQSSWRARLAVTFRGIRLEFGDEGHCTLRSEASPQQSRMYYQEFLDCVDVSSTMVDAATPPTKSRTNSEMATIGYLIFAIMLVLLLPLLPFLLVLWLGSKVFGARR